MLMLEHIGRKSGARRFRNLQANPAARVWNGLHAAAPVTARELNPEGAAVSLRSYTTRHRRAWKALEPAIENTYGAAIDENAPDIPMVELRLNS